MDQLRRLIRETIEILNEVDSAFSGAQSVSQDIEQELNKDLVGIKKVAATYDQDIKNKTDKIKSDSKLKNEMPANSPEKKGLDVQLPLQQKELQDRQKQANSLKDSEKSISLAKDKLEKQKKAIEKQTVQLKTQQAAKTTPSAGSVLPSLQSAI